MITDAAANIRRLLDILKLVDVDVALERAPDHAAEARRCPGRRADPDAALRERPLPPAGAPAPPPAPPAAAAGRAGRPARRRPRPAGGYGPGVSADRAPLIVPERRSNSLIIYARKQEMETIRRLIEKLDADIYGGQRIFFYFAENTKARDLAATLDAIFGRGSGSTSSTSSSSSTTRPGAAGSTGPLGSPGLPSQSSIAGSAVAHAGPSARREARARPELPRGWRPGRGDPLHPRRGDELDHRHDVPAGSGERSRAIIKKLDRMPRQVLIEVLAAEVTLDDEHEPRASSGRSSTAGFAASLTAARPGSSPTDRPPAPILPFGTLGGSGTLAGLQLLHVRRRRVPGRASMRWPRRTRSTSCRARPIMTTENKKAVINVSRVGADPDLSAVADRRHDRTAHHHRRTRSSAPRPWSTRTRASSSP